MKPIFLETKTMRVQLKNPLKRPITVKFFSDGSVRVLDAETGQVIQTQGRKSERPNAKFKF